jgi:Arc/MetJ-type ribon-helix-helix transcriptional regulator
MEKKNPKKEKSEQKEAKQQSKLEDIGNHVEQFAVKTAESIRKIIDKALSSRNTVLTIRVNEESNNKLNMLVESGIFKSRSESAAFLIQEGIKNQGDLFDKISNKLEKMDKIREELKEIISEEIAAKSKTEKGK